MKTSKEEGIGREGKGTVFMKCSMNHDYLCTKGFVAKKIGTEGYYTLGPVVHISVEGNSKQLYQEKNLVQLGTREIYDKLGEAVTFVLFSLLAGLWANVKG